jgi:hypothetical protein
MQLSIGNAHHRTNIGIYVQGALNLLTCFLRIHVARHHLFALIGFMLFLAMGIIFLSGVFELTTVRDALMLDTDRPNVFLNGGGLFALPFALACALYPMVRSGADGKRHSFLLNLILALVILVPLSLIAWGFSEAFYRCDILKIPNCD